ncbi:MAG: hypothetical protein CFE24_06050 [Flavobacterium sp. BFFFF2]|nr:MAG: hypothetical protein CFE24_06050 [Flavobacterium sp. BFFFF2]
MKIQIIACLALILVGCGTAKKIDCLKPEPQTSTDVIYESKPSSVVFPVQIPLQEISDQLNKKLGSVLYEDMDLETDRIALKVWKTAAIELDEVDGQLRTIFPLKIWAKLKYGTEFLGLNDTREFTLDGVVQIKSTVQLSNWQLTTQSTIEDIRWKESPSVQIAGKQVPITYLVNPALSLFKKRIARMIDENIGKTCDFKPVVLQALGKLSQPILTSPTYQAWFQLVPKELQVSDAVLSNKQITLQLGMLCNMHTRIGDKPTFVFDPSKIQLKSVKEIPNELKLSIAAVSTYEQAGKLMAQNFQGKSFGDKRKVTVDQVALWPKNNKIVIALTLSGSVNGTLYLTGIPNYNAVTQEIFMDNMDYVLDTKGVLSRTANWLLQGVILKKMQESCRFSIKNNLETARQSMQPYLKNYSPQKGITLNGTLEQLDFDSVQMTPTAMVAFITAKGLVKVSIQGLD